MSLSENERIAILQIIRGEGIGPITYDRLLKKYKTAQNVVQYWEPSQDAQRSGQKLALREDAIAEIEGHERFGAHLLYQDDPRYSTLLKEIPDVPPVLSVKGRVELLNRPAVGIVGARNGSIHGCKMARALAEELGQQGWVVSSGLARGIDAAAHTGSMATGTIGVLAGGINTVYPNENRALYETMYEEGLVVSEMGFGTEPRASFFPRRNRIIAGMTSGVVVVEAALQSGSLLTGKYALEYNREVFAVPGSPMDPRCGGSNKLLKQGAILVESAHDILDVLVKGYTPQESTSVSPRARPITFSTRTSSLEDKLIEMLSAVPVAIEDVAEQLGVPTSHMMGVVLELEVKGRLNRMPGNRLVLLDQ